MSLQVFHAPNGYIPIGRMVVLDESFQAIEYDEKQHTPSQIIGISYPKTSTTGRCAANLDGYEMVEYDYWTWTEKLQYAYDEEGNLIENPSYDSSFNPTTNDGYVVVCVIGLAPFDKTSSAPPTSWKKVRSGTAYDLYIVK